MPSSKLEFEWRRSATAAVAIHNLRNCLQSIMIEAAVLRRSAGAADTPACERIRALAQGGAAQLKTFSELLPLPELSGVARLGPAIAGHDVPGAAALAEVRVGCGPDALAALLRVVLLEALPQRGFTCARVGLGDHAAGRLTLQLELQPLPDSPADPAAREWPLAQQMVRDLGGAAELHGGDHPIAQLHLPRAD